MSRTITVAALEAGGGNKSKNVVFKNCAPFTDCIREINNTQVDNAKDTDIVMSMYNVIEYSDNYLNTSGSLWQYYSDKPSLNNAGDVIDFTGANYNSTLFKYKQKITGAAGANRTKNIEILVPLKLLSNFWKTLEMPLINCEINLILAWSKNWVIASNTAANQNTTFAIADTKLYIPTLSTQNNGKLLQHLKSGFKKTINWNKYQSKVTMQAPYLYLDFLIDPSFQGVNRLFVLSFENKDDRTVQGI